MRRPVGGSQSCRPRAIFVQYPARQALRSVCRPQAANQMRSVFCGGVYVAKNTSQSASVEFVRFQRTNYARGRLQAFCTKRALPFWCKIASPRRNPPGAGSIGGGASQLVGWGSSQAVFPFSGSASCGAEPQQRQPAEQRKPSPGPTGRCCSRRQS